MAMVIFAGLFGCGRSDPADKVAAMNDSNIRRLANLYAGFQEVNDYQGPADKSEFKAYIQNKPAQKLEMMQIDPSDIDGLFKSESTGEALEVIYGLKGFLGAQMAVVFDSPDSEGKRMVAFTNGRPESIDEQQYKKLKEQPLRSNSEPQQSGP